MIEPNNKISAVQKEAFTMIELIFVIVILGVLAAVAIPRLAGVQDDALIASEKSGIASIRGGIASLHGKMMLAGGDINQTIIRADGSEIEIKIKASSTKFPNALSVDFATKEIKEGDTQAVEGNEATLAIVLEPEAREQYKTSGSEVFNSTYLSYEIAGPASSTVSDSKAEISVNDSWEYNTKNGRIIFKKGDKYSSDGK